MCTHQPTADRLCVCLRYFSPTHHWLSGPVLHVSNTPLGHNGHTTIAGWDGSLDLTEKPGAVGLLTPVPGEKSLLPESAVSADSLTVSVQPPCAIPCSNICVHVKNPQHWQSCRCWDTRSYSTRRLKWIALLLGQLCPTRVRPPEFSERDNQELKNNNTTNNSIKLIGCMLHLSNTALTGSMLTCPTQH